jgi:hypothetical protein
MSKYFTAFACALAAQASGFFGGIAEMKLVS